MLTLKNVSSGYGGINIVKDISVTVNNNQCLSIIGPNGCGKTTLLKTITNMLPATMGDIEIDGKSVRKMKRSEIHSNISMLGQITGIYFSYSVIETVMMGRYLHIKNRTKESFGRTSFGNNLFKNPTKEDKEYAEHCLSIVNLTDVRDKEITKLSGGQLQRVFLARTLAQQPRIILLDEPTNHLDLKYQIELVEYLRGWAKQSGNIVIGVLHDINLAMRLSDNIMLMRDGRIAAYGKLGSEITGELLESVYGLDIAGYMRDMHGRWESL